MVRLFPLPLLFRFLQAAAVCRPAAGSARTLLTFSLSLQLVSLQVQGHAPMRLTVALARCGQSFVSCPSAVIMITDL